MYHEAMELPHSLSSAWGWYLMAVNLPLFANEVFQVEVVEVRHRIQSNLREWIW